MKRTVLTTHRGKSYLPEIALCLGPQIMGQPGSGTYADLYGRVWASTIEPDGLVHLWQATASDWQEVPIPQPPHDPRTMRHHSLAFDQSARHVLAYEIAGQIYIRQWDALTNQYVMRGPWPGVDPVVIADATVNYYVPDSDVLLFYLSSDRSKLYMRVQRELYGTAHLIQSFPNPQILDQAVSIPYQFELLGSSVSAPNDLGLVVRSDLYPVYLPLDALTTASVATPSAGNYYPVVVVRDLGTDALSTASFAVPSAGNYYLVVVGHDLTQPRYNSPDTITAANIAVPSQGAYNVA